MCRISLCMIVKDEEDTLEKCLSSVQGIPDEIIIVDTGSSDRTKNAARKFTDRIYDFEWTDDFSTARNESFSKAKGEYVLWLDADDRLLPKDRDRFLELKRALDPDVDVYMMKYCMGYDGQNADFSYYRERLVKRSGNFLWREPVHEYLEARGKIVTTDICVTHAGKKGGAGDRNLKIYEKLLSGGKKLSPRGLYYYGRELRDNGRFAEAAEGFRRFLDGGGGWVEDNIAACNALAECFKRSGQSETALSALLRAFSYDTPRAETCYAIGVLFLERREYRLAAYWFELCLSLKRPDQVWGFQIPDCRGFFPCLELAVCYDRLGASRKAAEWNERAARYRPASPSVLQNREYFRAKIAMEEGSRA